MNQACYKFVQFIGHICCSSIGIKHTVQYTGLSGH